MATDRDGVVTAKSTDTIQSVSDVSQMTTDADAERPWDSGVLNEARAFVLSGGGDDIFAMDLSSEFDGEDITSFVERRNFQLEPLASTETITGFLHAYG